MKPREINGSGAYQWDAPSSQTSSRFHAAAKMHGSKIKQRKAFDGALDV